jgi:hypothetical protein
MKNCVNYLNDKKRNDETVKLLRACYEDSLADEKYYNQGEIVSIIIEVLLEVNLYEEAVEMYMSKSKSDKEANKYHFQQINH